MLKHFLFIVKVFCRPFLSASSCEVRYDGDVYDFMRFDHSFLDLGAALEWVTCHYPSILL